MLQLLADENFNNDIVRGILLRQSNVDIVRVQDVGLTHLEDTKILAWAADNRRILLTHDGATMSDHAYSRIADGLPVAGVFILRDRLPVGRAIEEILLLTNWTAAEEWAGRAVHVPLH